MKRITFSMPGDLAALLEHERRRRDVPASVIVREALTAMLLPETDQDLWFVGIGRSEHTDTARRWDDILDEEWTLAWLKGESFEEGQNRLQVAEDPAEYEAGANT
ncbi:MAG: ribbon-helix-helix protein, CopG family [Thermomicrobiales bacterium]